MSKNVNKFIKQCTKVVSFLFGYINAVLFLDKKNQKSRFDEFLNAKSTRKT